MASTYLTYTPSAGDATARQKWTWSAWVKRSKLGSSQFLFCGGDGGSYPTQIYLSSGDVFAVYDTGENATAATSAKLRDTSAWYHLVARFDATQGTAADKMKLYINGVQQSLGTSWNQSNTNPSSMGKGETHVLGRRSSGDNFNGLMSHVHFCLGYSYGPDSFGSTDSTTGEWKINTSPSVSYGSQGFWWLKDNITTTDHSPNSNTFTVSGGTLTKTEDNPSNVFATLNPLNIPVSNQPTFSNGNTTSISSSSGGDNGKWGGCSTLGMTSGKFYCEAKATVDGTYSRNVIGITGSATDVARTNATILSNTGNSSGYYSENGQVNYNNSQQYTGAVYGTGDIVQIAIDLDNNRLFYGKNGVWNNSGDPTSSTGAITIAAASDCPDGAYFFAQNDDTGTSAQSKFEWNFGNGYFGTTAVSSAGTNASNNGIFEYDVPAGYTALSTKGLNL